MPSASSSRSLLSHHSPRFAYSSVLHKSSQSNQMAPHRSHSYSRISVVCQGSRVCRILPRNTIYWLFYRWSFGGNRLQIKAETHVLSDVQAQLEIVAKIGLKPEASLKSLTAKHDLLSLLISNEQTRLMVWLFPLDYGKKHHFTSGQHNRTLADVSYFLPLIEWD